MKILIIFLLCITPLAVCIARDSSSDIYSPEVDSIKQNFKQGEFKKALGGCVKIINKPRGTTPKDRFYANYYASNIFLYHGKYDEADYFCDVAQDFIVTDSLNCNELVLLELLRAKILFEKGDYPSASESFNRINNDNFFSCGRVANSTKTEAKIYRFAAIVFRASLSDSTLNIRAYQDSLENILYKTGHEEFRGLATFFLALAKLLDKQNGMDMGSIKEIVTRGKGIGTDTNKTDTIKTETKWKIQNEVLDISLKYNLPLFPFFSLTTSETLNALDTIKPLTMKSIIEDLTRVLNRYNKQGKYLKEYSQIIRLRKELIAKFIQATNSYHNKELNYFFNQDSLVLLQIEIDSKYFLYLEYPDMDSSNSISFPFKDLRLEKPSDESKIRLLEGALLLAIIPFIGVIFLIRKNILLYQKLIRNDAENEAKLFEKEEYINDFQEQMSDMGKLKIDFDNACLEIDHLKMELSHRLVNHLLFMAGRIESDERNDEFDKSMLAKHASIRLHSAIKLHRLLEQTNMKNSIYLPTFLSELSALVGKAFDPMRININTQQFSVEKQAPLSFAGDLGQLLLEWVFLLVDSGIGAVRFDFDIQPDKLGFSVVVSKDEWREKFREEPHFDILERKNPQIVNRIFFYLRKYNVNKKPEVMEIDQELRFTSLLNI